MAALLPYLEQDNLYRQFDPGKGYAGNLAAARTGVRVFLCPAGNEAAAGDAVTHYVALSGVGHDAAGRPAGAAGNGFIGYDRVTSLAMIKDGTSNTIGLTETRTGLGPWARGGTSNLRGFEPADVPRLHGERRLLGRNHPEGMNVAMADGSVRFVSDQTSPDALRAGIEPRDNRFFKP